jgi:hypothetical protein
MDEKPVNDVARPCVPLELNFLDIQDVYTDQRSVGMCEVDENESVFRCVVVLTDVLFLEIVIILFC